MKNSFPRLPLPAALLVAFLAFGGAARAQQAAQVAVPHAVRLQNPRLQPHTLSARTLAQIGELEQEKASRLPYQQKIDSNLWYAVKMSEGLAITKSIRTLRTGIKPEADGLINVDITADVTDELLGVIKGAGGVVVNVVPQYRAIRAHLPLRQLEYVAGQPGVQFIKPAVIGQTQGNPTAMFQSRGSKFLLAPFLLPELKSGFGSRAAALRANLPALLHRLNPMLTPNVGSVDSEGDTTHEAIKARSTYGVDGTGISIGVMSDSDDYLTNSQASGDLPANVTVISGQSGQPGSGEGTAMMEVVHDIAPGAHLFYATGNNGTNGSEAQMAANIIALHNAGCQIIVDDIGYFDESPFQDGPIAQAVDTVTAAGALYFSCATNNSNADSGEGGCWEDPFVDSGYTYGGGKVLDFHTVNGFPTLENGVTDNGGGGQQINLFWNDPLGKAADDYDLYVANAAGNIVDGSTNTQNGSQDPYESVSGVPGGDSLLVVLASGVSKYLHIDCGSQHGVFDIATDARTRGHNSVNAVGAYGVAATPAAAAFGSGEPSGPYPNPFNTSNVVENFSSDGPREQFFDKNGAAVSGGFIVLKKPDITAADGVSTSLTQSAVGTGKESFSPFFGTSCAAPHAAALAGLLLSYNPALTQAQVRSILTGHTIDIMASGWDRDSGYGILDAVSILAAAPAPPKPVPTKFTFSPNPVGSGQTTVATLTISTAAPSGGAAVALTENGASAGTFTITAGQTSGTFNITAPTVTAVTTESWTAALNGTTINATLTVNPPPAALSSVTFSPTTVIGGKANATGTVTLTANATAATSVTLKSGNTAALTVPASVTVAAGAKTATFTATSNAVTASTAVTVTATYSAVSKTATVTVTPALTLSSLVLSPATLAGGALSTTGTVTLTANATAATTVTLKSSNTAALTVPASVTVAAGAKTATFTATSKPVTASTAVTVTATYSGVSKARTITITPAALSSVTASPATVIGGKANAAGIVTLTGIVAATATVTLKSSNTAALTVPTSVTVAAGAKSNKFTAASHAVTANTTVTVTATYAGVSKTTTVTVTPSTTTVSLASVTASPTTVIGGKANSTGTVTLTANAAATTTVTLSSNNAALTVPSSVAVAAGQSSALFTATSHAVTASTTVTVTATAGGVSKTATVTVTPATTGVSSLSFSPTSVKGGSANTIGTVTMTANVTTATTVTLSSNNAALTVPSSVAVASGQNSAIFQATSHAVTASTTVTVTATAGGVSKTATVTVTP